MQKHYAHDDFTGTIWISNGALLITSDESKTFQDSLWSTIIARQPNVMNVCKGFVHVDANEVVQTCRQLTRPLLPCQRLLSKLYYLVTLVHSALLFVEDPTGRTPTWLQESSLCQSSSSFIHECTCEELGHTCNKKSAVFRHLLHWEELSSEARFLLNIGTMSLL